MRNFLRDLRSLPDADRPGRRQARDPMAVLGLALTAAHDLAVHLAHSIFEAPSRPVPVKAIARKTRPTT